MSILDFCAIILIALVWLCASEATFSLITKKLMYTRKLGSFGCAMLATGTTFTYAVISYWVMTITIM